MTDRFPAIRAFDDELTDGYARALTIEAECLGTMRRIKAAARRDTGSVDEIRQLATKLGTLQAELEALRSRLADRRRNIDPYGRRY